MEKSRLFTRYVLFFSFAVFLLGGVHVAYGATAQDLGCKALYVKDSILALFLPTSDGTTMKSRFITFDPKSADVEVKNGEAKVTSAGNDFSLKNKAFTTGLAAVLGTVRDAEGRLPFCIADYGNSGMYVWKGTIDLDGKITTPVIIWQDAGEKESHATDIVLADFNGDGIEEIIVGEVKKISKYNQKISVRVINSETYAQKEYVVAGTVSGNQDSTCIRLAFGDIMQNGTKQLALVHNNIKDGDSRGFYRFALYKVDLLNNLSLAREDNAVSEFHEDQDVLDLAVGNFSGAGRDEVIVFSDYNTKSSSGKFHFKRYYLGNANDEWLIINPSTARTDYDGARVAAFDLDNDGRDEFVWVASDSAGLCILGVTKVSDFGKMESIYHEDFSTDHKDYSMSWVLDMVAGSYLGRYDIASPNKRAGEIILMRRSWDGQLDNVLTILDPELENGRFKSFKKRDNDGKHLGIKKHAPILLSGNIKNESLRLSDAEYVGENTTVFLNTVIQMPPKHMDYIPIPWNSSGSFINALELQSKDMLYATTYESFLAKMTSAEKEEKTIGSSTKKDWGFTAGPHFVNNGHLQLDIEGEYAMNTVDEYKKIEGSYAQSSMEEGAKYEDKLLYIKIGTEYWRFDTGKRDPSLLPPDDKIYYTVALPLSLETYTGVPGSDPYYRPIHEPYNALSYPSDIRYTLDYLDSRLLHKLNGYSTNVDNSFSDWCWGKYTTEESGRTVEHTGEASLTIGVAWGNAAKGNRDDAKRILEGEFGGHYFYETSSTVSSTWEKSTTVSHMMDNVHQQAIYKDKVPYTVSPSAFTLPNGGVELASSVTFPTGEPGKISTLWDHESSVYVRLPDLALNLPFKYTTEGKTIENEFTKLVPVGEPLDALQMRGLRIKNKAGCEYPFTFGLIPKDLEGTVIEFPVYNYSVGKDISGFNVRVSIVPRKTPYIVLPGASNFPEALITKNIHVSETVPAHRNKAKNWVLVSVPLSINELSAIPSDLGSNLDLFVELDPSGEITETHENWDYGVFDPMTQSYMTRSGGDPSGNNLGYQRVSVVNVLSDSRVPLLVSSYGKASVSSQSVKIMMDIVGGGNLTRQQILDAIKNKEDMPLNLEFYYEEGPEMIPGFTIMVTALPEGGQTGQVIARKSVPALTRSARYPVNSSLKQVLLTFMADKKGKINIDATHLAYDLDLVALKNGIPFGEDKKDSSGGSSGGCSSFGFSAALAGMLLLHGLFRVGRGERVEQPQ